MHLLGSLRNRPFATLWSGQTVSRFGDAVHQIALAWLVLQLTGSAAAMGAVLAAQFLPFIAFSLVGGVIVDRLPRLRVMLASDLARMVIVAVLAALVALDRVEFWHLIVLAASFRAVEAFFYPAYAAAVPELVPAEHRPSANSLHQLSRRFAQLLGPAVGAGLVAGGGTGLAFAIDAVSFLVSAVLIVLAIRLRARETAPAVPAATTLGWPHSPIDGSPPRPVRSSLADLRSGRVARRSAMAEFAKPRHGHRRALDLDRDRRRRVTGITLAGPLEAVLPLLVSEHLGGGVAVLRLLQTMISVGPSLPRSRSDRGPGSDGEGPSVRRLDHVRPLRRGRRLPVGIAGVALVAVVIGACGRPSAWSGRTPSGPRPGGSPRPGIVVGALGSTRSSRSASSSPVPRPTPGVGDRLHGRRVALGGILALAS
jgi:MFS family permease